MATYYFDSTAAAGGTGTESSPFDALADWTPANGDVAKLKRGSRFRESFTITGLGGIVVEDYGGASDPPAEIRGDVVIGPGDFGSPTSDTYPVSGVSSQPATVVVNWDASVDASGRHYGHLELAADLATCQATPGTWFWDDPTDTLHIHDADDSDPRVNGKTYARGRKGDGLVLNTCDNCLVRNLVFKLWSDPDASSTGYGLRGEATYNTSFRNIVVYDSGGHAIGFASTKCLNNSIVDCTAFGLAGANADSQFIFGLTGSPPAGFEHMTGCVMERCVAFQYQVLGIDGAPVNTTAGCTGFACHTGSSSNECRDVRFIACRTVRFNDVAAQDMLSFTHSGTHQEPSDKADPSTYGVRYIDCQFLDGDSCGTLEAAHTAFVRCAFDLPYTVNTGGVGGIGVSIRAFKSTIYMESCTISAETAATATHCVFRPQGTSPNGEFYLRNCTFLANGSTAGVWFHAAGNLIDARQCIFDRANSGSMGTGGAATASDLNMVRNTYSTRISDTGYSAPASFNSQAEWQASVDAAGFYDSDPTYADTDTLEPAYGSFQKITQDVIAGAQIVGINKKPYDGRYGAHQYGIGEIGP